MAEGKKHQAVTDTDVILEDIYQVLVSIDRKLTPDIPASDIPDSVIKGEPAGSIDIDLKEVPIVPKIRDKKAIKVVKEVKAKRIRRKTTGKSK